jgi:(2R)-3-sulfolactate dehydrogenase (NADP+)
MVETVRLTPKEARTLIVAALVGAGTAPANTGYMTDAILDTELSGLTGHGFYWLQYYCAHLASGKVKGKVKPSVKKLSAVSFRVDAKNGFAHPAIEAGFAKLIPAAKKHGVAAMGVTRSYSAATLGFHTGYLARHGLVAFGFTNAMPTIAPVGGRIPVIGTNPLSFAVPGPKGKIAFLIDQSSSTVAWTAVKRAAEQGKAIPLGWALDSDGNPTADPNKGLAGSMAPFGGYKGFGQGLIVEVMSAAMTGACLGPDMGSFTEDDGRPIGCGQFFIALDPKIFAGGVFAKQMGKLVHSIVSQKGARLPNARRAENVERLSREGLTLEREIFDRLSGYAAKVTRRARR